MGNLGLKSVFFIVLLSFYLFAKGTVAGYKIENQATITLNINGIKSEVKSNIDSFVVDKIIDIKLNSQDSSPVEVGAGEVDRVLTFSVANLGNSKEEFNITYEDNSSSDFKIQNPRVFIDSNNNGVFDSKDKEISSVVLENDESATLFLVANIPDNNETLPDKISINSLKAKTNLEPTNSEDLKDKVDIVVRNSVASDSGEFIIRNYWLGSKKSANIKSEDGVLHTGSIIDYKIEIFIDGKNENRKIDDIILKDAIPSGTTYIANSLRFNGDSLTDSVDSDIGSFANEAIEVKVGTIKDDQKVFVEFSVKVN